MCFHSRMDILVMEIAEDSFFTSQTPKSEEEEEEGTNELSQRSNSNGKFFSYCPPPMNPRRPRKNNTMTTSVSIDKQFKTDDKIMTYSTSEFNTEQIELQTKRIKRKRRYKKIFLMMVMVVVAIFFLVSALHRNCATSDINISSIDIQRRRIRRSDENDSFCENEIKQICKHSSKDNNHEEEKEDKEQPRKEIGGIARVLRIFNSRGKFSKIGKRLEYETYPRHPEFPHVDLSSMMKLLKGPPPKEYAFTIAKIARILARQVRFGVIGLNILRHRGIQKAQSAREKFDAVFTRRNFLVFSSFSLNKSRRDNGHSWRIPNPLNIVPEPAHTKEMWTKDKELARQFLAGTNPIMIRVVDDVGVLPRSFRKFFNQGSDHNHHHHHHHIDGGKVVDLKTLAQSNRLFYVSYDDLAELGVNPHPAYPAVNNPSRTDEQKRELRYFYAPIIVLYLDDKNDLDILAIQLEREDDSKIYTKFNCDEEFWMLVKAHLANADSQIHQWVSHLGLTHFAMEPHLVAIHNVFRGDNDQTSHPLYSFLSPLTKDTLFVNWASRKSLAHYDANSFGDYASSVGVGQIMQLIKKMWSRYDFMKSGLPHDLARRGFHDKFEMPSYLYREDGLKLWSAYGDFAKDFVNEVYATDNDVKKDKVLQAWAEETSNPEKANIPGFPSELDSKEILVEVLQTLYWTATALHAAVNSPQYDFYAVIGNKPLSLKEPIPNNTDDLPQNFLFEKAIPDMKIFKQMLGLAYGLAVKSDRSITGLLRHYSSRQHRFGFQAYKKHWNLLQRISKEIDHRNKERREKGLAPYNYLNPTAIPASIHI